MAVAVEEDTRATGRTKLQLRALFNSEEQVMSWRMSGAMGRGARVDIEHCNDKLTCGEERK